MPLKSRHKVLGMLFLVSIITYLDRIAISAAAPKISEELGLSPAQMGLVFSAFVLAYGLFEIPGGWMGDRFGPRLILTRIVVWWSIFTAATGTSLISSSSCARTSSAETGCTPLTPRDDCTVSAVSTATP